MYKLNNKYSSFGNSYWNGVSHYENIAFFYLVKITIQMATVFRMTRSVKSEILNLCLSY